MGAGKDIDELRRAFFGSGSTLREVFYAAVKAVDKNKRTCSVEAEEIIYEGVSLYAVENDNLKGRCVIPATDSTVLVGRIGGSNELYVVMFSELEEVVTTIGDDLELTAGAEGVDCKVGDTSVKATTGGITLKRGKSGLKKTLGDLCDAIGALTVPTGVGPSGIPANKAQFDKIKRDLENYMEG